MAANSVRSAVPISPVTTCAEMIAMLGAYPQLYVDLGGIQWFYPREYSTPEQCRDGVDVMLEVVTALAEEP